jgi:hypothetical protein
VLYKSALARARGLGKHEGEVWISPPLRINLLADQAILESSEGEPAFMTKGKGTEGLLQIELGLHKCGQMWAETKSPPESFPGRGMST